MQTFINRPPELAIPDKDFWPTISLTELAQEPSLFSCSPEGVGQLGGTLSKKCLSFVEKAYEASILHAKAEGLSAIIDVRVQRLMPGMFPSIPGWHCDAVPRCSYHGQPRFSTINPAAFHVSCTLSSEKAGVSNTEFVNDSLRVKLWDEDHVYQDLHRQVERLKPMTRSINDGVFAFFTPKTIHRATETHRRGWRMFFRFSMYHKPPIANGVPGQQQVYLLSEANGW